MEADNPAQGWQARFSPEGLSVVPLPAADARGLPGPTRPEASTADAWSFALRLRAYGAAGDMAPVPEPRVTARGQRAELRYGGTGAADADLTEWFVNDARGIEHGFTLAAPPAGDGPLTFELGVSGRWQASASADGTAVALTTLDGSATLRYADLYVSDATGRALPARMEVPAADPARIDLIVDAGDAVYPVTVDPLLTGPSPTLTGEAFSSFGYAVATAGDVNGDGYSDVIVGAPTINTDTGRAYVFLGDAAGLATTPATTLIGEGTQNWFGWSVATAGDVNGDGYADVVVGAHRYASYTGRAYTYLGGPGGVGTVAATTLTGEGTGDQFAWSVATAGDVNGDGYSDVVIGADAYGSLTGRVYVHLCGDAHRRRGERSRPCRRDGGRRGRRRLRRRHRRRTLPERHGARLRLSRRGWRLERHACHDPRRRELRRLLRRRRWNGRRRERRRLRRRHHRGQSARRDHGSRVRAPRGRRRCLHDGGHDGLG
jgi:hypothetical protein